jgi:hypothetical protein
MFAATTSPSYSPTWVSGQMPVTSPMLVDADPVRLDLDADRLQADPLDARAPAGGDQQLVAPQLRTVVELQHILVALPPGGGRALAEHQLDPVPAQGLAERLAQRRGLAGHHPVGALDHHRFAAETPHDLRELDACGPAAQHEQAARDRLHARRLPRPPDTLELTQARDRRHDRIRAGGHHDVLRGVADAVDLDHAGTGQPAGAAEQVDAPAGQPALLAGVGPV